MSTLRVAVAQILSGSDPQQNLELVATQTAEAADQGAQLVVFPEATMRRFGLPLGEIAEPVDGPWAKQLREIAEHHDLGLLGELLGCLDAVAAEGVVVGQDGDDVAFAVQRGDIG